MSTKTELEVENKSLRRELGSLVHSSQIGTGAAATARAQSAMNASIEVGIVGRAETMEGNNVKRDVQQAAVLDSGQSLTVSHSPVTGPAQPAVEVGTVESEDVESEVEDEDE